MVTDKQKRVLDFIKSHIEEKSYPPTRAEIAGEMGVTLNAAVCHIRALERKGLIDLAPNISRGITVK